MNGREPAPEPEPTPVERIAAESTTTTESTVDEELQRSIAELRASEARFRTLVESTSDIIHVIDENRMIRYMSPQVERILGYKPEELIGTKGSDLLHPDDREVAAAAVQEIMSAGPAEGRGAVQRLRHRDGSYRSIEVRGARILDADGRPTLVAVSRDITERERLASERRDLEKRLREAQKLQAVGQLAGGIAHDFNNLLMAIDGHAQLLLEDLDATNPMRGDLLEIHKAAERAAGLTRQLLAFSRRQALQPATLDLGELVAGMRTTLDHLTGERVDLRVTLADELRPVEADRRQIEQVFLNLAMNARDAMADGGCLTISTSNAELGGDEQGEGEGDGATTPAFATPLRPGFYVVLAVSDTGRGIDEKIQARIFEPFFTTKEVGKGTGLGLATVYGIVRQSGGEVAVESDSDRGTTFKVYLPADGAGSN